MRAKPAPDEKYAVYALRLQVDCRADAPMTVAAGHTTRPSQWQSLVNRKQNHRLERSVCALRWS